MSPVRTVCMNGTLFYLLFYFRSFSSVSLENLSFPHCKTETTKTFQLLPLSRRTTVTLDAYKSKVHWNTIYPIPPLCSSSLWTVSMLSLHSVRIFSDPMRKRSIISTRLLHNTRNGHVFRSKV